MTGPGAGGKAGGQVAGSGPLGPPTCSQGPVWSSVSKQQVAWHGRSAKAQSCEVTDQVARSREAVGHHGLCRERLAAWVRAHTGLERRCWT